MTGQGRTDQQWMGQPNAAQGGRPARYGMGNPEGVQVPQAQVRVGAQPQGQMPQQAFQQAAYPPSSTAYAGQAVGQGHMPFAVQGYPQGRAYPPAGAYVPPPTSVPPEEKKKKRGAGFWVAIILAVVAVVVAILLALTFCTDHKKDRSGDLGQLEGKSAGEIQAELDRVVEEGMFNISIASVVEMADGTSPAELRIENVPNNNYLMQVTITREDTGEQVYQTDVIEPNHHIQQDTLDVDLDAGSYDCLATFTALDPETEDPIGEAAANIKINVLS